MRSMNIREDEFMIFVFQILEESALKFQKSWRQELFFFFNDSFDSILLTINRLAWHIAVEIAWENFEFVNMKRTLYTLVLCNIITK